FSPLKVYEYMAAGLPVIASRIGQLEEVIEHGVTGWLVPPGDANALALGIQGLRASPASFRKRLGAAARCYVLQCHSWDAVGQQILELAGLEPATEGRRQRTGQAARLGSAFCILPPAFTDGAPADADFPPKSKG